jgi:hypothetical protein
MKEKTNKMTENEPKIDINDPLVRYSLILEYHDKHPGRFNSQNKQYVDNIHCLASKATFDREIAPWRTR